jgi:hypothetical protein
MSDKQASIPSDRFHIDANVQAHFAWLRTRLAAVGSFAFFSVLLRYQ